MTELTPQRTFTHEIGGITHHFAAYQAKDLPSLEFFGCAESEKDLTKGRAGYGADVKSAAAAYWNQVASGDSLIL